MIVAIDGPSGTGKSTISKMVAKRLGLVYFNTGAMYRSFALYAIEHGVAPDDKAGLIRLLSSFTFTIDADARCYIGSEDVTEKLSLPEVTKNSSIVSQYPEVREGLLQIQRAFAKSGDAVFEGRDIGTVVFPDADVKIFLTASAEVRAERRHKELVDKHGKEAPSFEQVFHAIEQRDKRDMERAVAPLRQADDATLVDSSTLDIESVVDKVITLVTSAQKK